MFADICILRLGKKNDEQCMQVGGPDGIPLSWLMASFLTGVDGSSFGRTTTDVVFGQVSRISTDRIFFRFLMSLFFGNRTLCFTTLSARVVKELSSRRVHKI